MLGKVLPLKTTTQLVFFLSNNRIVDYLEKYYFFSGFWYGFRSSLSTANLLKVVSDRIAGAFNRSWATLSVALEISKAFDRVWHASLLHKLRSYGISGQIFGLIFSFLSNRQLWVVLEGKSSQEYLVNAWVPQGFILGPFYAFPTIHLMTFLMMLSVILLSMLMILLSAVNVIRHLMCGNNENWLLNLNLIYETLWTGGGSGLLISMGGWME